MAKKRTIPAAIRPYVIGYLEVLKERKLPITSAYLFGSWAKGKQHKWSDIDMCIVSPKLRGWTTRHRNITTLPFTDLDIIEPHGFNPKEFKPEEDPLVYEIMKYGIKVI